MKAAVAVWFTGFIGSRKLRNLSIKQDADCKSVTASRNYPHPPREGPRRAKECSIILVSLNKSSCTWIESTASSASTSQRVVFASFKCASTLLGTGSALLRSWRRGIASLCSFLFLISRDGSFSLQRLSEFFSLSAFSSDFVFSGFLDYRFLETKLLCRL